MNADKLAQAIERTARHRAATDGIDPDQWRVVLYKWEAEALAEHDAQPAQAAQTDIFEAYKTWPADIREKLSLHDLRRMSGWGPSGEPGDWSIDTSTPSPILTYQKCSVIQDEHF